MLVGRTVRSDLFSRCGAQFHPGMLLYLHRVLRVKLRVVRVIFSVREIGPGSSSRHLAFLLVGLMLLCQGILGSGQSHYAAANEPGIYHGQLQEDQPRDYPVGFLSYAAAGVALLLLGKPSAPPLRNILGWGRTAGSGLFGRVFALPVPYPVRGPTVSLLQAFRL